MRWPHLLRLGRNMQNTTFHKKSHSDSTTTSSEGLIIPTPDSRPNRTVVLCFDGTGDQFGSENSNVVQFFRMLVKHHPAQIVYYQAGIGTYTIPEIATPLMATISKTVDMMFGKHLDAHVMGGYEFLMQNYQDGDKICIFGFSRGAYTARALAGMIDRIGLIPSWNHQQVPFAYHMYSRGRDCEAFKQTFSINVNIEFVGVWDTVSSVGFLPKILPFSRASNCIKYFRHALALDERRVRFKPNTWHHPNQEDKDDSEKTDVQEVWFAGAHCDVGGGSVANDAPNSLARIPLRWMIRECFKAKVGILFHQHIFKEIGMDPAKLDWDVQEQSDITRTRASTQSSSDSSTKSLIKQGPAAIVRELASEEDEEAADAVCETHDQLKEAWWWWILECTPQPVFHKDADADGVVRKMELNMGRGRSVSHIHTIKVHRSVQTRMKKHNYVPKAAVDLQKVDEWVD